MRPSKPSGPAAPNVLQQQMRFDTVVHRYQHERPHQALDMGTPASCYTPSARLYRGLEPLDYPFHDWTAVVNRAAENAHSSAGGWANTSRRPW